MNTSKDKRVSVKTIEGEPKSLALNYLDNNLVGVKIYTTEGEFMIEKSEAYSSNLKITRDYVPERKPVWKVEAKFKDASTSTRVFFEHESAKDHERELAVDRTCNAVRIVEGTVAVDDKDEVLAGTTKYGEDDIPF